jgi:NADPH:quinone reductase-like Zn-dependent oxidoreductase
VGTFAVQLAKAFGAEATGVCSTTKVELVRSIGADHVIDYTQEDFGTHPLRRHPRHRGEPLAVAPPARKEDLEELRGLVEASRVAPVIDRTFPLSEAPEAIRYMRKGHARGKVVITV